jgi:hypothetical protein
VWLEEMMIARHSLPAYPDWRGTSEEPIDLPHCFQVTLRVYRMRQRQRHEGWLQMLAGIPEFGQRQVSSQVTDMPARLLHRVRKCQQP